MAKGTLISYPTQDMPAVDPELTSGPQWSPAKTTMLYDGIVNIQSEENN